MTREVSGYNGRDGKTQRDGEIRQNKKYRPSRLARRDVQEKGEIVEPRGARVWCPSGPSPQGVSHVRGNTPERKTNIGADK